MAFYAEVLRNVCASGVAAQDGRYGDYVDNIGNCVQETYGYHIDCLESVVLEEKLVLYSAKDGWGSL